MQSRMQSKMDPVDTDIISLWDGPEGWTDSLCHTHHQVETDRQGSSSLEIDILQMGFQVLGTAVLKRSAAHLLSFK